MSKEFEYDPESGSFPTLFVLRAVTFAFGLVLVRMPLREEFTFFGLSESLEMSAMRPMGHRPKAKSAAMMIQLPMSPPSFFFGVLPPSSKRNEPLSGRCGLRARAWKIRGRRGRGSQQKGKNGAVAAPILVRRRMQ